MQKQTPIPNLFYSNDYLDFWGPMKSNEITLKEVEYIEKELNLKPGDKVLDLCCGYGRHSNLLAERGYSVTGADVSTLFLKKARKNAREKKLGTKFINLDARKMRFKNVFNGCFNFFSSFGYYSDEENEKIIQNVYLSLINGSRFLIDMVNREYLMKNFKGSSCDDINGNLLCQITEIDFTTSRMNTRWIIIKGTKKKEYETSIRVYSPHEFINIFKKAGFKKIQVTGRLGKFTREDPRMVVSGVK